MSLLLDLPLEVSTLILGYLSPVDLSHLALSSRHLHDLISFPDLWRCSPINSIKARDEGFISFFSSPRYSKISILDLTYYRVARLTQDGWKNKYDNAIGNKFLEEMFKLCLNTPSLKELNLEGQNLSLVSPPHIIGQVVANLRKVNFDSTNLTSLQSTIIFSNCLSSSSLEDISFRHCDLSRVHPDLVCQLVPRIKSVNLEHTNLTHHQSLSLLTSISPSSSPKLKHLKIGRSLDLYEIPSDLFSTTIGNLVKVDLEGVSMTRYQLESLLETILLKSSRLSSLSLFSCDSSRIDYSYVSPNLIGTAISRLRKANLALNSLSSAQVESILRESLTKTSHLSNLNLQDVDLSNVDAEILGKAVAGMIKVDLSSTRLTETQCTVLLNHCAGSSTLRNLRLGMNENIGLVHPDILAKAVVKLVNLDISGRTKEHSATLLQAMLNNSSLKAVNFKLNDMSSVPVEVFAEAVSSLEKADLWGCNISEEQCEALMDRCIQKGRTKFFNFGGNNLGQKRNMELGDISQEIVERVKKNTKIVFYPVGLHPRLW